MYGQPCERIYARIKTLEMDRTKQTRASASN